jgi:hypothetical protein
MEQSAPDRRVGLEPDPRWAAGNAGFTVIVGQPGGYRIGQCKPASGLRGTRRVPNRKPGPYRAANSGTDAPADAGAGTPPACDVLDRLWHVPTERAMVLG